MVQQHLKNQFKLKTLSLAKMRPQKSIKSKKITKQSSNTDTCKRIITLLSTTTNGRHMSLFGNSNYQKDNGCAID